MSISGTISLLQTLHASISGVTTAPTAWPTSELAPANFPLVLCKRDEGSWLKIAGKIQQSRVYEVSVFMYENEPAYYAKARTLDQTLVQAFGNAYIDPDNHYQANPPDLVQINSAEGPINDTEMEILEYLNKTYFGFRFRVSVTEFDTN